MSATSSSLIVPTDPQLASVIIANMLENWLDSSPHAWTTPEVTDEPENLRTAEEQTGLHLCASVDACASAPPSGEYRASVCAAAESSRIGLERTVDPHPRSGFGSIRCSYTPAVDQRLFTAHPVSTLSVIGSTSCAIVRRSV